MCNLKWESVIYSIKTDVINVFNKWMILCWFVCLMVFNATFNNISVISWRSVLLVEETGGPGENHRPVASHWQTLSHNVVSRTPHPDRDSNSQHQWCQIFFLNKNETKKYILIFNFTDLSFSIYIKTFSKAVKRVEILKSTVKI